MTTLVCDELVTTLEQSITLTQYRVYHIEALKIRIVMYNAPSGTFTLSVKSGVTTLASKDFTSAEIKSNLSTTDDYAYIDKLIQFDNALALKSGVYTLELSSSGYSYTSESFIGWVKSYENIFNDQSDNTESHIENPFDFLIYEKVKQDLVR